MSACGYTAIQFRFSSLSPVCFAIHRWRLLQGSRLDPTTWLDQQQGQFTLWLQTVEPYIVDPANCGAVSCCYCASPTLPGLEPTPTFLSSSSSGGLRGAFAASPATGQETSCDVYTLTQTFALIGRERGQSDELSWSVGGSTLRSSQDTGSGELRLQVNCLHL